VCEATLQSWVEPAAREDLDFAPGSGAPDRSAVPAWHAPARAPRGNQARSEGHPSPPRHRHQPEIDL